MRYNILLMVLVLGNALAEDGLCLNHEQTVFSCRTRQASKYVSVCASKPLEKPDGYLQYRFGSRQKVELEYPSEKTGSIDRFRYSHYFRYQVDRTELTFRIGAYRYSIFSDYEGDAGIPETSQGVTVSKTGSVNTETEILCQKAADNNLQVLENRVPCDRESAPAGCPE